MKRQALDHTKMDLLMEKLDLPRYACVGILESLWHLTAREAPRGDIGKLSNERIAIGIDWRGSTNRPREREATRLIQALTEAEWLEVNDVHRLVIHDWAEHADDAVKKYMKRNGLEWACRDKWRHVATSSDMSRLPVPEPVPEDQHQKAGARPPVREMPPPAPQPPPSPRFEEWWTLWSSVKGTNHRFNAEQVYPREVTEDLEQDCLECTRSYLESLDNPAKGYNPENFLIDQRRDKYKSRWPPRSPTKPQRVSVPNPTKYFDSRTITG